jgi:hypothetical protein
MLAHSEGPRPTSTILPVAYPPAPGASLPPCPAPFDPAAPRPAACPPPLPSRFQPVVVPEPTIDETYEILQVREPRHSLGAVSRSQGRGCSAASWGRLGPARAGAARGGLRAAVTPGRQPVRERGGGVSPRPARRPCAAPGPARAVRDPPQAAVHRRGAHVGRQVLEPVHQRPLPARQGADAAQGEGPGAGTGWRLAAVEDPTPGCWAAEGPRPSYAQAAPGSTVALNGSPSAPSPPPSRPPQPPRPST